MLNKLLDKFITERHHLILEEEDVYLVLGVINSHHKAAPEVRVGNCGWGDDPKKWFIFVSLTKEKWEIIRRELKVIRVFSNTDIPINTIGAIYTTD